MNKAIKFHQSKTKQKCFLGFLKKKRLAFITKLKIENFRKRKAYQKCFKGIQDRLIVKKRRHVIGIRSLRQYRKIYISAIMRDWWVMTRQSQNRLRNLVRFQTHKKYSTLIKVFMFLKNLRIWKRTWKEKNNKKCQIYKRINDRKKQEICFYAFNKNLYDKVLPYKRRVRLIKKRQVLKAWDYLCKKKRSYQQKTKAFILTKKRKIFWGYIQAVYLMKEQKRKHRILAKKNLQKDKFQCWHKWRLGLRKKTEQKHKERVLTQYLGNSQLDKMYKNWRQIYLERHWNKHVLRKIRLKRFFAKFLELKVTIHKRFERDRKIRRFQYIKKVGFIFWLLKIGWNRKLDKVWASWSYQQNQLKKYTFLCF